MKKLFVLVAMAMLFVPATASAFEVVIPYFLDGGKVLTGSQAAAEADWEGGAAFITMVNLTADTLNLGVVYTDQNGVDGTPTPNSFEIEPFASFGFRPVVDDPLNERSMMPASEDSYVPNAEQVGTFTRVTPGGHGGSGGLRLLLIKPDGSSGVEDYPNYGSWGPQPFAAMMNQYVFYGWALAGSGMEAGFVSKPLD